MTARESRRALSVRTRETIVRPSCNCKDFPFCRVVSLKKAAIRIEDFAVLQGRLPPRVMGFVVEWAGLHQEELFREWELAREEQPLFAIEPLR